MTRNMPLKNRTNFSRSITGSKTTPINYFFSLIPIDGGNSEHQDTTRRCKELEKKGLLYVGSGVSGGEEGARYGPSLMPGGHTLAWPHIKDIFQTICAQCEKDACCDWVGEEGAGHYVKMVHNGIEYGDMQVRKYRVK